MEERGEVRQFWGSCKALRVKGDGSADFVVGVEEIDLDCDKLWLVLEE